jgi:formate/nitrite transporter FocA (FNT family)
VFCITFFVLVGFGHGIVQGKTMLYKTHQRTSDKTIAKSNKDKQCYTKHIEERQTIQWPKPTSCDVLCITLFVLVDLGHAIV